MIKNFLFIFWQTYKEIPIYERKFYRVQNYVQVTVNVTLTKDDKNLTNTINVFLSIIPTWNHGFHHPHNSTWIRTCLLFLYHNSVPYGQWLLPRQ